MLVCLICACMREVKVFRIKCVMKHRTFPEKFVLEVPALKKEHAIEYVYSVLGSRHKLSRKRIVIEEVEEISPEKVKRSEIKELLNIEKIVL